MFFKSKEKDLENKVNVLSSDVRELYRRLEVLVTRAAKYKVGDTVSFTSEEEGFPELIDTVSNITSSGSEQKIAYRTVQGYLLYESEINSHCRCDPRKKK